MYLLSPHAHSKATCHGDECASISWWMQLQHGIGDQQTVNRGHGSSRGRGSSRGHGSNRGRGSNVREDTPNLTALLADPPIHALATHPLLSSHTHFPPSPSIHTPLLHMQDLLVPSDVSEAHELVVACHITSFSTNLQSVVLYPGMTEQGEGRDGIVHVHDDDYTHLLVLDEIARLQAREDFMEKTISCSLN